MIKHSKQNWQPGQIVNIGFLKGFVVKEVTDIKDGMPDIYLLERNGVEYEFIPHHGLTKKDKFRSN